MKSNKGVSVIVAGLGINLVIAVIHAGRMFDRPRFAPYISCR